MEQFIPYGKQSIDEADIEAVVEVLRSDMITTGPYPKKFEEALSTKVGAKYAVVFSSGTAALHAAYFVAGLKPGEEVITSPITFAATANAALYLGGSPVFVDIALGSFNIDIAKIEAAITSKTRIIAPVDIAGIPVDIDAVMQIAAKHNLVVVEDAAHALGAIYKGRTVGSTAHMTIFSFHPAKHITTGEGGAVATNDASHYEKLLMFRSHGITRDPAKLEEKGALPWHQEMQLLGYNYRLTDILCALGLSQMKKLEKFLDRRREIVDRYNHAFRDQKNILTPPMSDHCNPAWHLYIIRLQEDLVKTKIVRGLREKGIGTQVHYVPVYRHPYYAAMEDADYRPERYPHAEAYYQRALSIPLYPAMTEGQVEKVIEAVINICR